LVLNFGEEKTGSSGNEAAVAGSLLKR